MKTSILIKLFFVLPLIIFADYIIMAIFGGATCLMGFGNDFYCGTYCFVGKILITLSGLFFIILISPEIGEIFKSIKNVKAAEK